MALTDADLEKLIASLEERKRSTAQLQALGRRRERALAEADGALAEIGQLLPLARQSGLKVAQIARVTGVSRPTLYALQRRSPEPAS